MHNLRFQDMRINVYVIHTFIKSIIFTFLRKTILFKHGTQKLWKQLEGLIFLFSNKYCGKTFQSTE